MRLADDEPITLKEACEIYFKGRVGVPALLAESRSGKLETWKVGRTRLTNLAKIKAMEEKKCLEQVPAPVFGSTRAVRDGRSAMAKASAAQAAVAMRLGQQKKNSPST